jgi:hypothetical protein
MIDQHSIWYHISGSLEYRTERSVTRLLAVREILVYFIVNNNGSLSLSDIRPSTLVRTHQWAVSRSDDQVRIQTATNVTNMLSPECHRMVLMRTRTFAWRQSTLASSLPPSQFRKLLIRIASCLLFKHISQTRFYLSVQVIPTQFGPVRRVIGSGNSSSFYWDHLSRLHLEKGSESSLIKVVILNKIEEDW